MNIQTFASNEIFELENVRKTFLAVFSKVVTLIKVPKSASNHIAFFNLPLRKLVSHQKSSVLNSLFDIPVRKKGGSFLLTPPHWFTSPTQQNGYAK